MQRTGGEGLLGILRLGRVVGGQALLLVHPFAAIVGKDAIEVEGDPQFIAALIEGRRGGHDPGSPAAGDGGLDILAVGTEEQAGLEGFQIRVRLTPAGETQPADGQAVVVDRPAHTQPGVRIVARKEHNLDRAAAGGKQALDEGHRHARRGRHGLAFALVLAVGLGPVRAEDGIALGEVEERARRDRDREQGWLREGRLSHRRRWPRRRHRDRRAGGRPSLRRRR